MKQPWKKPSVFDKIFKKKNYENNKGYFISVEGMDGSGKTTLINNLKEALASYGLTNVIYSREPGGTIIAEKIRALILDRNNTDMTPWTEALLYIASRNQHINEVIKPALAAKKIIISDRFIDSTVAYQGAARNIGGEDVLKVQEIVFGHFFPDLTILLELNPKKSLERLGSEQNKLSKKLNRLDVESDEFHILVSKEYKNLATSYPDRIKVLDASLSEEELTNQAVNLIFNLIGYKNGSTNGK